MNDSGTRQGKMIFAPYLYLPLPPLLATGYFSYAMLPGIAAIFFTFYLKWPKTIARPLRGLLAFSVAAGFLGHVIFVKRGNDTFFIAIMVASIIIISARLIMLFIRNRS